MAKAVSNDVWETTATAIWDTIADMHTGPKKWHALDVRTACRDTLRTYSDLDYNPLTSPNPWGASWYTHNPNAIPLGGTWSPSQADYMSNRYTMVSLTEDLDTQASTILDAGRAMQASSHPARVAILADDTPYTRQMVASTFSGKVRSHILATVPTGSIILSPLEMDKHGEKRAATLSNPRDLILILIENDIAPGFDLNNLSDPILESNDKVTFYPFPWSYKYIPDDFPRRSTHTASERLPPSTYPNMAWCRSDLPATISPSNPGPLMDSIKSAHSSDRPTKDDVVHAILACLGTTSTSMKSSYAYYAPPSQFFHEPPPFTSIPKLILYSTLDIYRKSEAIRKWKT
jgi:hypothetical protein